MPEERVLIPRRWLWASTHWSTNKTKLCVYNCVYATKQDFPQESPYYCSLTLTGNKTLIRQFVSVFTGSQNGWIGRDIKAHPIPTPATVDSATHQLRLLRAPSNLDLNVFRDGAPTASLGSCASASLPFYVLYRSFLLSEMAKENYPSLTEVVKQVAEQQHLQSAEIEKNKIILFQLQVRSLL